MANTNQWCVPDEMHDALVVDFDRSLSSLDMDLGASSNSVNTAVFAVPDISSSRRDENKSCLNTSAVNTVRCHQHLPNDVVSNEKCQIDCYPVNVVHGKKIRFSQLTDIDYSNTVKRFCVGKDVENSDDLHMSRCRPHSLSAPEMRAATGHHYSMGPMINTVFSQVVQFPALPPPQTMEHENYFGATSLFHYILMASTAISSRVHEETLTYLNQGQPYEIKMKKIGELSELKHKIFKSIIYVGFQERRLQYVEKEQITEWQADRVGERILEVDIPLSYGVLEAYNCPGSINMCEILWDPLKDNGIYIKVNCISTEFTTKKHGGEKGVPFRILIETYAQDDSHERLHTAACQVKVFKPKGAERKHKTDREKMIRKSQADKEKFHPQYEFTVFKEICSSNLASNHASITSYSNLPVSSPTCSSPISNQCSPTSPVQATQLDLQLEDQNQGSFATSTTEPQEVPESVIEQGLPLTPEFTEKETAQWLHQHMFGLLIKEFTHFTGADLLKLRRQDLIDICGLASGIRLYNLLHVKSPCPCLILYIRLPLEPVFHAVYLDTPTVSEMVSKLRAICCLPTDCSIDVFITGPSKIRIVVTDEVIQNMVDESMFTIEFLKSHYKDSYVILLQPFKTSLEA